MSDQEGKNVAKTYFRNTKKSSRDKELSKKEK
jgi:hypothetical protein